MDQVSMPLKSSENMNALDSSVRASTLTSSRAVVLSETELSTVKV